MKSKLTLRELQPRPVPRGWWPPGPPGGFGRATSTPWGGLTTKPVALRCDGEGGEALGPPALLFLPTCGVTSLRLMR